MIQKTASIILIFVLAFALVACSALSNLSTAAPSVAPAAAADTALESKLAVGILKLEGTAQAVTVEQATDLLAFWQGVQLLTSNKSASGLELAAFYQQIQETLTAEQVSAIQQVSWTAEEITGLIKAAGGATAQGSAVRKTGSAQTQTGGGPGGGNADLALINGATASNAVSSTQTTPVATRVAGSSTLSSGLNAQLAGAVIDLLQKRVAA